MASGKVKWFDNKKGFGFIAQPTGQDVFVHHTSIMGGGFKTLLEGEEVTFDIIFNDIDKEGYPDSLPVIKGKLRQGGILIIDNMLWSGRPFDSKNHENSTEAIRRFTRDITTDPDWIVSLTPMRDGMIVAYKK